MEENNESRVYTLSDESLRKLLQQSFRSGALSAYQTLHAGIEANVKDEHFNNEYALAGFNYCKNLIEQMIMIADETLAGKKDDV